MYGEATRAITDGVQRTFGLTVVGGNILVLAAINMRFEGSSLQKQDYDNS
jgi:small neutral amino acid transporter SnatA (MarC family)